MPYRNGEQGYGLGTRYIGVVATVVGNQGVDMERMGERDEEQKRKKGRDRGRRRRGGRQAKRTRGSCGR